MLTSVSSGQIAERGADRRLPLSEQRKIVRLQGVLVLRIAGSDHLRCKSCADFGGTTMHLHLRQLRPANRLLISSVPLQRAPFGVVSSTTTPERVALPPLVNAVTWATAGSFFTIQTNCDNLCCSSTGTTSPDQPGCHHRSSDRCPAAGKPWNLRVEPDVGAMSVRTRSAADGMIERPAQ